METGARAELDRRPERLTGWRALEARLQARLLRRAQRRQAATAVKAGGRPLPEHLLTGERGEDAAYFFLCGLGMHVVARRWKFAPVRGDLDLVAWEGETLVIVEVKTRTARDAYAAEEAVDAVKVRQLRALAKAFLRRVPQPFRAHVPVRFDIVAVYLLPGAEPEFERFVSAFPLSSPDEARSFFAR